MRQFCLQYQNIDALAEYVQSDLRKGQNSLFGDSYIITATAAMRNVFRKERPFNKIGSNGINTILHEILPCWYDDQELLAQYFDLGGIIESVGKDLKAKGDFELASALKKNRNEIAKALRLLLETSVMPKTLNPVTKEEKALVTIYERFVECSSVKVFLAQVADWNNSASLKEVLSRVGIDYSPRLKVFFQGFYYITPLQERLLHAMINAGFNVIYLNNYDENVAEAYKIWDKNTLFENLERVNIPRSNKETYFKEVFNNTVSDAMPTPDVEIVECKDIFSMVKMIGENGVLNSSILCPNKDDVEKLLTTFFPEFSTKGQLLSYPIGQYLLSLYKMWSPEDETVMLTVDNVRTCLATGWVGRNTDYSAKYLEFFDKVSLYFKDCNTLDEWQDRVDLLESVNSQIIPLFKINDSSSRWPNILGNPLSIAAVFSGNMDLVEGLIDILQDIFDDVKRLFGGSGEVDLAEHFRLMLRLVREKVNAKRLSKEENIIAQETIRRFRQTPNLISKCSYSNLSEAMSFYLGGDVDEIKESISGEKESIGPVYSLADVESVPRLNKNNKLFLCFCDDKRMPEGDRELPWPLTEALIETSKSKVSKEQYRYIQNYMDNLSYRSLISRYLFYVTVQNKGVNLSWVAEYNDKVQSPSPYIRILCDKSLYGLQKTTYSDNILELDCTETREDKSVDSRFEDYEVMDLGSNDMPAEIIFNRDICPKNNLRNIYDFGLQSHPAFSSEFHMDFYIGTLLKIMKTLGATRKGDSEEANRELFSIFPVLRNVKEREMISYEDVQLAVLNDVNSHLNGLDYSQARMYLKYLRSDILKAYYNEDSKEAKKKVDNWNVCAYCPHGDNCIARYKVGEADE